MIAPNGAPDTVEQQQQQVQQVQTPSRKHVPSQRILVVAETTYTQAPAWPGLHAAIEHVLRWADAYIQPHLGPTSPDARPQAPPQYALVLYSTDDPSSYAAVQSSGWTTELTTMRQWMDGVQFRGGGGKVASGTALAAALAEVIYLSQCPYPEGTDAPVATTGVVTHMLLVPSLTPPSPAAIPWPSSCAAVNSAAAAEARATALALPQLYHRVKPLTAEPPPAERVAPPGYADYVDLLVALQHYRISLSVVLPQTLRPVPTPASDCFLIAHHHMPALASKDPDALAKLLGSSACLTSPHAGIVGSIITKIHSQRQEAAARLAQKAQQAAAAAATAGAGGQVGGTPPQQAGAAAGATAHVQVAGPTAADGVDLAKQGLQLQYQAQQQQQQQQRPHGPQQQQQRLAAGGFPAGPSPPQQQQQQLAGAPLPLQSHPGMPPPALLPLAGAPPPAPPHVLALHQQQQQAMGIPAGRGAYPSSMPALSPLQMQAGTPPNQLPSPKQGAPPALSPNGGYMAGSQVGAGQQQMWTQQQQQQQRQQFAPGVPPLLPQSLPAAEPVPAPMDRAFWTGKLYAKLGTAAGAVPLGEFSFISSKQDAWSLPLWSQRSYLVLSEVLSSKQLVAKLQAFKAQHQTVQMAQYQVQVAEQGLTILEDMVKRDDRLQVGLLLPASAETYGLGVLMVFGTPFPHRKQPEDPQRPCNMGSNHIFLLPPRPPVM